MRASAKPTDPGYTPDAMHYRVYVDGKRLKHCHTADEEAGEAIVFLSDPKSVRQSYISGQIPEQKLTGVVKIIDTRTVNQIRGHYQDAKERARRAAQLAKGQIQAPKDFHV